MIRVEDIEFEYSKPAEKFFRKHEAIREEFRVSVAQVINRDNSEQINYKPLQGKLKGYSRIAIKGYRIIYRVEREEIVVVIVAHAGSRGDIYKKI